MTHAKDRDVQRDVLSRSNARMQRYRAKHKRIDYAPSPEALAAIEAWLKAKLDNCTAGVIDRLVLAGHRSISGNGRR